MLSLIKLKSVPEYRTFERYYFAKLLNMERKLDYPFYNSEDFTLNNYNDRFKSEDMTEVFSKVLFVK